MAVNNEDLRVFLQLGMTTQQAKVYIALSKLEQATVKTIADTAQTARAEVYRAIPKLQKLGLIKKIITTPISFRATPLSEALTTLLQQNAEKHKETEKQAQKFLRNFQNHNIEKPSQENTQYHLTSGLEAESREFSRDLAETQTSSDVIFYDWRIVLYWFNRHFEVFKKALERGVKIRCITHVPEDEKMSQIIQTIQTLMKAGSFEVKSASTIPKGSIDILDKKSVHIIILPNDDLKQIEVLRSQNPAVVELAQDYFDMKWQSATTPCWHKKTIN
jgi:sugar-specific transcriptional regulator TrmB